MGRYSSLLGKQVEVEYRFCRMQLHAVGKLIADTGEFVLFERNFDEGRRAMAFSLKVPYACIMRLSQSNPAASQRGAFHSVQSTIPQKPRAS